MTAPQGTSNDGSEGQGAEGAGGETEFKPITSQDDLNKVISERIARERAKFSDYKALKDKAAKYDELEESQKSEIQRAADAKAAAEAERDAARAEALRLRIATKHGISDEDADLFLTGTDEETLTRQAERLASRAADRKKQGNYVAREGGNQGNQSTAAEEAAFARELFGAD